MSVDSPLPSLSNDDIHREKMVYLGQLTAGVAHELNNPIGYISSNIHTLEKYIRHLCTIIDCAQEQLGDSQTWTDCLSKNRWDYIHQDIHNLLKETGEGTDHLKHVVADLKTLGRSSLSPEYMNVNSCILSALNVMTHQLKNDFDVQQELGELAPILIIRPQIIQCISNLIHNSIQARDPKSHTESNTKNTTKGIIRIHSYMKDQQTVISIEDNGPGIKQEHRAHIFEPFFTTKDSNNGSGLGLPIVAAIIKHHHGSIHYQCSERFGGAQFIIRLNGCMESS